MPQSVKCPYPLQSNAKPGIFIFFIKIWLFLELWKNLNGFWSYLVVVDEINILLYLDQGYTVQGFAATNVIKNKK